MSMLIHRFSKARHLSEFLATEFLDQEIRTLYHDIFGSSDTDEIQKRIYGIIPNSFGTVRECLFTAASIGAVFGFNTTVNQQIVLKVYPRRFTREDLNRIHIIQNRLNQLRYPAPGLLSNLIEMGPDLHGVIMEHVSGHRADGHDPLIRKALAHHLAEFSKIVEKEHFPEVKNPFQSKLRARLWPIPHKSTIHLKETSKGAGFIRDRALRARKTVFEHNLPAQLAHLDWGVKNARFSGKRLTAVFDWDSLGSMSEAEMVGQASAQFTADWETGTQITPSQEEAWDFLNEYQGSRGKRFSKKEMEVVSASADYIISLIARFEYAGKVTSENSFLHLLRSLGSHPLIKI